MTTASRQISGFRKTAAVPTLSQMIREGQQSAAKIKRSTKEALVEWFAQSERLNIARAHYRLRGTRFIDFAGRIGIDKSSAYQLLKLSKHKAAILARCSGFRDWCGELGHNTDAAEAALSHRLGDQTRVAYQRGTLLAQRERLMQAWADYCASVIPLETARAA